MSDAPKKGRGRPAKVSVYLMHPKDLSRFFSITQPKKNAERNNNTHEENERARCVCLLKQFRAQNSISLN